MNQMTHFDGGSIYRMFAENLFELVRQRGTISSVCLALDINRQQFNKYLNGSVLPNEITMRKIIDFFNVDIAQLFQESDILRLSAKSSQDQSAHYKKYLEERLSNAAKVNPLRHIREGLYYSYTLGCQMPHNAHGR